MYYSVKEVQPLKDYILKLKFEGGVEKTFDMKPYLEKGIFSALKDENAFLTAKVSFDTVEWMNEIDIDPETLYHNSVFETTHSNT